MSVDQSLVGRSFGATAPYEVTAEAVRDFAEATGNAADSVPPTFPVVITFAAMNDFLAVCDLDLSRIVHGDQRFVYERPVRIGDTLTASLEVTGLRQIGGNDIISTANDVVDADGALVCRVSATLVHRGPAA